MTGQRSDQYQLVLDLLIRAHPEPRRYEAIIVDVSYTVPPGRAHREAVATRNTMRRLRGATEHEDEVTDRSIRTGRRHIARQAVQEAIRNGRIISYVDDNGFRMLKLGTPAETGGRHSKQREWPNG